jgi:phosphoserine aminotransferase
MCACSLQIPDRIPAAHMHNAPQGRHCTPQVASSNKTSIIYAQLKCETPSSDVPVRDIASAALYMKCYMQKSHIFFVSVNKIVGLFHYTVAKMRTKIIWNLQNLCMRWKLYETLEHDDAFVFVGYMVDVIKADHKNKMKQDDHNTAFCSVIYCTKK